MKKHSIQIVLAASVVAAGALFSGCASLSKPVLSSHDVMEQAFKGDTSLFKKIASGQSNAADNKLFAELVANLPKNKPTKGDAASWTAKSTALASAAKDFAAGKGSLDALKAAANCKACHSVHKPD